MKFIDLLTGKSSTLAHDNTASEDAKVSPTVGDIQFNSVIFLKLNRPRLRYIPGL